jgi:hypothetical protein
MNVDLVLLEGNYSIYQFEADASIPESLYASNLCSVTCSKEGKSVIAETQAISDFVVAQIANWQLIRIENKSGNHVIHVVAAIIKVLQQNDINLLTFTSFEYDYLLLKSIHLSKAINALHRNDFRIVTEKHYESIKV